MEGSSMVVISTTNNINNSVSGLSPEAMLQMPD